MSSPTHRRGSDAVRRSRRTPHRRLLPILLGLLLLATGAPVATADSWTPQPPAPSLIPDGPDGADVTAGRRERNDLAVSADGVAWSAWNQTDDTTMTITPAATHTVRVSRRAPGGAWSAPEDVATAVRVASSNYQSILGPKIGVAGDGTPTVAWAVRTAQTSVTIYAARRTSSGWAAPAALATVANAIPTSPTTATFTFSLDVAADGSATVAWQDLTGVRAVQRSAAGSWEATPESVAAESVDLPESVAIGRDRTGRIVAAWRTGGSNDDRTVRAAVRSSGGSWGAPTTVSTATGNVSRVAVAVDDSGAAVVTWGSSDGPRAAVLPAGSGAAWSAPEPLATGSANAVSTDVGAAGRQTSGLGVPSASFDRFGTASVVWPEAAAGEVSARVRLRTVDQTGAWGAPETVATESSALNPPLWPRVVLGLRGPATVVWSTKPNIGFSGGVVTVTGGLVRATTRAEAGGAWSEPVTYHSAPHSTFGTFTVTGASNDANLSVAGDVLGNATLSWSPYKAVVVPSGAVNESASHQVDVAPGLDWTARGMTGSTNLRTWVDYLYTAWPGPGPTTEAGVQASDGAVRPSPADRYSWRLTQQDAWKTPDGRTVVQYDGTIRWVNTAHYIDNRVTDPRLEIAPDGSARLYANGQASGPMSDAIAGNPSTRPISNVRLLDLQLPEAASRLSADGSVRTWTTVPATANVLGASEYGMDTYAGQAFGSLTISVPKELPVRTEVPTTPVDGGTTTPPPSPGGTGPGGTGPGGTGPGMTGPGALTPGGGRTTTGTGGPAGVTGKVKGSKKAKRRVTIVVSRRIGTSASRTYRVQLRKGAKVVATGTLEGRTLELTVRNVAKRGRKARYARIAGAYSLATPSRIGKRKPTRAQRITTTKITVR